MMYSNRRQLAINSPANSDPISSRCRVIVLFTLVISFVILVGIAGLIIALTSVSDATGSDGPTGSGSEGDGSQPGPVRLNPQQVANLEANYAQLIADMGGVFRPELLSEPEFYTRDLIGGFTEEQEQQFLSSCGNPDVLDAIPEGDRDTDTSFVIFTRYVTQRVQIPFNRRKRQGTSRVCPGTPDSNTRLVLATGRLAQLIPQINDWVFNERCSFGGSCQSRNCRCSKIGREVVADVFVINPQSTTSERAMVTIYSCAALV
ncbi:uncharacterized protein [Amphiura filiformis]|uniref:uncharacterized protein isoform X4 n=1 Tax=Amphiura filiformis TaxID=82378 RepID=UPI003B2135E4